MRADLSDSQQLTEMVDVVVRLAINRDESWWERAVGEGGRHILKRDCLTRVNMGHKVFQLIGLP